MAEAARDLETDLRKIRDTCKHAIEPTTGKVDVVVIAGQAQALKSWLDALHKEYTTRAIARSTKSPQILAGGEKLLEDGWFCYNLLLDVELQAAGPPPTLQKFEGLVSGIVQPHSKSQMFVELDRLVEDYRSYKRDVLGI